MAGKHARMRSAIYSRRRRARNAVPRIVTTVARAVKPGPDPLDPPVVSGETTSPPVVDPFGGVGDVEDVADGVTEVGVGEVAEVEVAASVVTEVSVDDDGELVVVAAADVETVAAVVAGEDVTAGYEPGSTCSPFTRTRAGPPRSSRPVRLPANVKLSSPPCAVDPDAFDSATVSGELAPVRSAPAAGCIPSLAVAL